MEDSNRITLRKIGNYALTVALFAGLAGMFLSIVFMFTEPQRLANARRMELQARQLVAPEADSFVERTISVNEENTNADRSFCYVEVYDQDKNISGYLVSFPARGYSSDIMIMAGISLEYSLKGMTILSQSETPGLGTRVEEPWFIEQFAGKSTNALAVQQDGGEIAAITGATISSAAVADGVREKINLFKNIMQEANQNEIN